MGAYFVPRCASATGLVLPVGTDPLGVAGPTKGQARGPGWRRSTPRRYVPVGVEHTVEQHIFEQAQRLLDLEDCSAGAVGGWASLRLRGAAYFDGGTTQLRAVPLVVRRPANLRPLPGSRTVRVDRELPVSWWQGMPCLGAPESLLLEMLDARDLRHAVTMADMALAAGVTSPGELTALADAGGHGSRLLREVLRLADERSQSPWETWLRLVWMLDAGLPRPRCNWTVGDEGGRPVGSPDLLSQEIALIGEYNGSAHRQTNRARRDAARDHAFRGLGLDSVTVVGARLGDERVVARRLREAATRAAASGLPRRWTSWQRSL